MIKDIERILINKDDIEFHVRKLAKKIEKAYPNGLTIIHIMSGAMIFVSDLIRCLPMKMKIDLMSVSSYNGTKNCEPIIRKDIDIPIEGRDILIVDDIFDTGKTLSLVTHRLAAHHPASIKKCVLMVRGSLRDPPDFFGFQINSDAFVVGYGLDYNGYYRNFPHIGILKREIINAKS